MNVSPVTDPTEIESLLSAWELASISGCTRPFLSELLRRMRIHFPIQNLWVCSFDLGSQSLIGEACTLPDGADPKALESRRCSEAKWRDLMAWSQEGRLLRQSSIRRSGKLAYLAPEVFSGEVMALALAGNSSDGGTRSLGAMVLELDSGRTLHEGRTQWLQRWAGPCALALEHSLGPKHFPKPSGGLASPVPTNSDRALRETIVGAESGLRSVMERVQLVAGSDMPVLILGETGTGKEVVARAIHLRSARSSQPFLRVNCGAIPPELIDSQLFGHERGSFTGASDQRKGWFERADGGTLFLDEIGELSLAAQVRLLRVLQEQQIERVGGQVPLHVDVRIVAATHRDLAAMVHHRTFREDLWYRINMFPILLPRLHERTEDIPALAKHFARKAAASFGFPYVEPTSTDIDRLVDYPWPGNIRELQAVMDRAVILGRGIKLDIPTALGIGIVKHSPVAETSNEPTFYEVIPESTPSFSSPSTQPLPQASYAGGRIESLNESIKQHIERALIASNGQVEGKRGAASKLQINPHTLRAKMRKLGIRWTNYRTE